MAMLWKLPCIFVCENNGYGMGTSNARSSYSNDYYTRGDYMPGLRIFISTGFRVEGLGDFPLVFRIHQNSDHQVDGMDVLAVREATRFARYYVLKNGPLLIECRTYRYSGHTISDPGTSYRTKEEVKMVKTTRDPITIFKQKIIEANLATEDEVKKIDQEVRKEVKEAEKMAIDDSEPPVEDAFDHVYAHPEPDFKVRTCDPHKMVPSK